MNKRELYENIMTSIAKQVKQVINENYQKEDIIVYSNYEPNFTDEDFKEEIEERGNEAVEYGFFEYMAKKHADIFNEYSDNVNNIGEAPSRSEMEDYFIDFEDEKDKFWNEYLDEEKDQWFDDMESMIWHDVEDALKDILGDFVIFGTKESWDRSSEGLDIEEDTNLLDVFRKQAKDCDYFRIIELANGGVQLKCSHHDGTNMVEIHLLNEEGIDTAQELDNADSADAEKELLAKLRTPECWDEINLEC